MYAFSENFILPLSFQNQGLLDKMPGDDWQKFAGLRLLYSYMICQPGKKLLSMGGEFGMRDEWNSDSPLPWKLLDQPSHKGVYALVHDLNHFYRQHPALWERDHIADGFKWIEAGDDKNSVLIYSRRGKESDLVCLHNFTPMYHPEYFVKMDGVNEVVELFNTDRDKYGGTGKLNPKIDLVDGGFRVSLAPLATMIFSVSIS